MTTSEICSPSLIAPRELLTPERLDIAVKWRFFRHLHMGNDADSGRIYRWHIEERTGGREARSWKRTIEDYVTACEDLLDSMLEFGFNPEFPLEYRKNGTLRSGAHRLACSLLLNLDVYYIVMDIGGRTSWGENWFVHHGMALEDLKRIKTDWKCLKQS